MSSVFGPSVRHRYTDEEVREEFPSCGVYMGRSYPAGLHMECKAALELLMSVRESSREKSEKCTTRYIQIFRDRFDGMKEEIVKTQASSQTIFGTREEIISVIKNEVDYEESRSRKLGCPYEKRREFLLNRDTSSLTDLLE